MPDDPHGVSDGVPTVDPESSLRSRQRAGLRAPWQKGQSGNPNGRPKQALWFRTWCRRLLAGEGLEAFALKVKQGDMAAIRLALAYAYGPPPVEVGDVADDEAISTVVPDPSPTTREDKLEEILLEGAQDEVDRRMRLRAAGLTVEAFERMVKADRQAHRSG
jgi:hypothetical protein